MMKFGGIVLGSVGVFIHVASLCGMKSTTGLDDYNGDVVIQMQQLSYDSYIKQETHTLDLSVKPLSLDEIKQTSALLIEAINANDIKCLKIAPNISEQDEIVAFQWLGEVLRIGCGCKSTLKEILIIPGGHNTKGWMNDLFSYVWTNFSTLFEKVQNDGGVDEQLLKYFEGAKTVKIGGNSHVLVPMTKTEIQTQTSKKWTVISSIITGVVSIGLTIAGECLVAYIKSL